MPPAIIAAAITGAVAIGGMVSQNVQNKAAIKNNENQQSAAVANANQAHALAQTEMQPYLGATPASTGTAGPAAPTISGSTVAPAPVAGKAVAPQTAPNNSAGAPARVSLASGQNPMTQQLLAAIGGQGGAPVNPQTQQAVMQLLSQRNVAAAPPAPPSVVS
jgi:hypothetical protein